MNRFLFSVLVILTLVVGTAGAAPAVYAQDGPTGETAPVVAPAGDSPFVGDLPVDPSAGTPEAVAEAAAAQKAIANGTPSPAAGAAGATKGDSNDGYNSIMFKITGLFAWLVGVAILIFNYSVHFTVITMGAYVKNLTAIGETWTILRDIGNIFLIFGFLAVGITTIINVDWYGGGKKMLPMMLVAAVFLNFSLFITEAFIDVSNLFATQFYTQINSGDTNTTLKQLADQGISGKIMNQLGLASIYQAANVDKLDGAMPWFIGFMGIILFIILAFVFLSLAFVLIARFVILVFLIILSPIGFAGLAVPMLKKRADEWWQKLFEQVITAPVLLLLLYIALRVITAPQFLQGFRTDGSAADWGGFSRDVVGFGGLILSFLVAMGLLLYVVIASKQLGAFGAAGATKLAGKLSFGATAMGMSAMFGGGAFLARKGLQRYAPNNRAVRAISNYALRPLENRKFDIRSAGVGAALGAVGLGEVSEPVGASVVSRGKQGAEWLKKTGQEKDRQYQQETVVPRLNAAVQQSLQTGDYRQVSTILSSMSDKDFETSSAQRALLDNPAAAAMLSQARYEKIQQSEAISDARKAEIAQARRDGDDPAHAQSRFYMGGPAFPAGHAYAGMTRGQALISTMNTATRGKLGGNVLTENTAAAGAPPVYVPRDAMLNLLDTSDFEAIRRTGELTTGQRQAVGDYILRAATAPVPAGAVVPPRQASLIAASAIPAFRAYYNL